ncbi:hypothetical protein CDL15_Pgr000021 [Punica granatum]|uniref:Uncharacterized protein n=1 Tax=Punica granatum TaxID=22663 RepID=A0A218VPZ6_PUNGR|nr:hypothetical protein CDL15_Pgr000021 [Punica granatum]PKI40648.1 hypothetical protein CRG98_038963 [Punica granatum]
MLLMYIPWIKLPGIPLYYAVLNKWAQAPKIKIGAIQSPVRDFAFDQAFHNRTYLVAHFTNAFGFPRLSLCIKDFFNAGAVPSPVRIPLGFRSLLKGKLDFFPWPWARIELNVPPRFRG